jgi:hypothetical protein
MNRKITRCAIYTRKSTEEGLEQDFNSLDAQREAGEAYIKARSMKVGSYCRTNMMTAVTPVVILIAPVLKSYWLISLQAR